MWKWIGLFLRKNYLLRFGGWLSLLNWIGAFKYICIAKTASKKLEPWFALWHLFFLKLLCISINLPYGHAWNTVIMSGLVLLVATWNCWINYKNGYTRLLVLHLLPHLNPWLIVEMSAEVYRYYFGRCSSVLAELVPILYSRGSLLVILIDCMVFLSPFLGVTRMSMSTVSLFAQLDPAIFCLENGFPRPTI